VRALAGIVLALALASPATAATVAWRSPETGPALSGSEVLWGARGSDGSIRVMAGAPGRRPRIVHRIAGAPDEETSRHIWDLEASSHAYAFQVETFTSGPRRFGSNGETARAAFAGPPSGGAALIAGSMPDRVDDSCGMRPQAVEIDGTRIAVATADECELRGRLSITIHDGTGDSRVVEAGRGGGFGGLAFAGRYVAWFDSYARELVLYDLEAGRELRRLRTRDVGGGHFGMLDVDAGGALVFSLSPPHRSTLGALLPGRPGVAILDRRLPLLADFAVDGGLVLYARRPPRAARSDIVLRGLTGGPARTLRRFPAPGLVGGFDLESALATWVEYRPPRGTRIVMREL
jgi:hypothetical protein